MKTIDKYLSLNELADKLNISPKKLKRIIIRDNIDCERIGNNFYFHNYITYNLYKCPKCDCVTLRQSRKMWIKTICGNKGVDTRLIIQT